MESFFLYNLTFSVYYHAESNWFTSIKKGGDSVAYITKRGSSYPAKVFLLQRNGIYFQQRQILYNRDFFRSLHSCILSFSILNNFQPFLLLKHFYLFCKIVIFKFLIDELLTVTYVKSFINSGVIVVFIFTSSKTFFALFRTKTCFLDADFALFF